MPVTASSLSRDKSQFRRVVQKQKPATAAAGKQPFNQGMMMMRSTLTSGVSSSNGSSSTTRPQLAAQPMSSLLDGPEFDEKLSRESFQDARKAWLKQQQQPTTVASKTPAAGAVSTQLAKSIEARREKRACYQCYKQFYFVKQTGAGDDDAKKQAPQQRFKNFCTQTCADAFLAQQAKVKSRVGTCSSALCKKRVFLELAYFDDADASLKQKPFCSKSCAEPPTAAANAMLQRAAAEQEELRKLVQLHAHETSGVAAPANNTSLPSAAAAGDATATAAAAADDGAMLNLGQTHEQQQSSSASALFNMLQVGDDNDGDEQVIAVAPIVELPDSDSDDDDDGGGDQ
jgi:hypothetical protein